MIVLNTLNKKRNFVTKFEPYARIVASETGLPVVFILAQAAYESAWGSSNQALTDYNYFGIMPGGVYAKYPSIEAGWQAYSALINSPRYSGVRLVADKGPCAIAQFLVSRGYNSVNPDYTATVAEIANDLAPLVRSLGSA